VALGQAAGGHLMDLAALQVDKDEAREKLAEYEKAVRASRSAEDEAIAAGYRAAARGLPVISLPRTVAAGGFHDNGLPRIAVVGAEAVECCARWDGDSIVFADGGQRGNRGALVGSHSVRVRIAADDLPGDFRRSWRVGRAMVPLIPPRYRPSPRRLRHCHILWEVEQWAMVAPRDPALLRHIRGDLWAVLAVWDLTDLERMVLSQRRFSR
jgi:hypothetical protein